MIGLLRPRDMKAVTGVCKTTVYQRVKDGLLPPPVKIGPKSVAWPALEINTIVAAQIAGKPDSVIRALVRQLITDRKEMNVY